MPERGDLRSETLNRILPGYCRVHTNLRMSEDPAAAGCVGCCQGGPGSSRSKVGQDRGVFTRWGPSCLLHWLALLPLRDELGKFPHNPPPISGLQTAFHLPGKALRGRQAGPLWPRGPVCAETDVPVMGPPRGRRLPARSESKPFFPEACPFQAREKEECV